MIPHFQYENPSIDIPVEKETQSGSSHELHACQIITNRRRSISFQIDTDIVLVYNNKTLNLQQTRHWFFKIFSGS